jgi:hypothetical protein
MTNFAETELLDHVYNAAYSAAAAIYLCLCTADPTDAATGASMSEVADLYSYQRTAITFGAAASRVITQNADVDFPAASGGSWGTVTHWAICDNQTHGSGNVLAAGAFAASKTINDGNTPSVVSAEINVTISADEVSDYLALNWLDLMFRNQVFAAPATHVALCTATVADNNTGTTITEPGAGAYAREQVNVNGGASPTWDVAVEGDPSYVDNTHAVAFTTATASWGTIVAVAVCDAATVGNLLMYDNAMADQAVGDGDTAEFAIGVLDAQLS